MGVEQGNRKLDVWKQLTGMIGFITAFLFILNLFVFVLLAAGRSESCFWTLKKSFPFPLADVEHLILSNESDDPAPKIKNWSSKWLFDLKKGLWI